jgi:hypothetical protein
MRELKSTQKAKVFISSLNRHKLGERPLSAVRDALVERLEERFPFLTVDVNEDWPAIGAGDPRKTTQHQARTCHLFLGILVDAYGFKDRTGLSATQIEFEAAIADSREKMLVFVQDTLKDPKVRERQPDPYLDLLDELTSYRGGKIVSWFKDADQLVEDALDAVNLFCATTMRAIRRFPDYASAKTPLETQWELMTFTDRHRALVEAFHDEVKEIELQDTAVRGMEWRGEVETAERYDMTLELDGEAHTLPVLLSACPDRFSYADAARYVGYPFRTCVESWDEPLGPLHIVAVFRTVTDTQVRRHLGNPDIHVFKESWGFYAADPERFIQIAYLVGCSSPRRMVGKVREFLVWLDEYEQLDELLERARIRGKVLAARR